MSETSRLPTGTAQRKAVAVADGKEVKGGRREKAKRPREGLPRGRRRDGESEREHERERDRERELAHLGCACRALLVYLGLGA